MLLQIDVFVFSIFILFLNMFCWYFCFCNLWFIAFKMHTFE